MGRVRSETGVTESSCNIQSVSYTHLDVYKRQLVYNPNILNYFFEVFLKESAKTLKDNDVVEHIFSTVEKGA